MRNLNKVIKISYVQGGNLEEELNKFLTAYRTTPLGLLEKPQMRCYSRDVFAQRYLNWFLLINVMKKYVIGMQFSNRKEYADDKKYAKYPDLKVNDKVLLQQRKTMYEHDPYEIVDVNGSQVMIKSGEGVCYKRNYSHVRKFEQSNLPSGNEYIDDSV
jgi:hypothetical protein